MLFLSYVYFPPSFIPLHCTCPSRHELMALLDVTLRFLNVYTDWAEAGVRTGDQAGYFIHPLRLLGRKEVASNCRSCPDAVHTTYQEEGAAKNATENKCPVWRDLDEGGRTEKYCNLQVSALHFNQRVIYPQKDLFWHELYHNGA